MIDKVFKSEDDSWYIEIAKEGGKSEFYGAWPNVEAAREYYYKTFYHNYSMVSVDCCQTKEVPEGAVVVGGSMEK